MFVAPNQREACQLAARRLGAPSIRDLRGLITRIGEVVPIYTVPLTNSPRKRFVRNQGLMANGC
jgi:hypothetical protein